MIKRVLVINAILFLFFGCISKNVEYDTPRGKNIIPFDTLGLIIYDIHITDAMLTTNVLKKMELSNIEDSLIYESVFEKYLYTKDQLNETLLYYTHNALDSLDMLYDRVLERYSIETINIQ